MNLVLLFFVSVLVGAVLGNLALWWAFTHSFRGF